MTKQQKQDETKQNSIIANSNKIYIYLVENCYGDPNKVYIGKTIKNRKPHHKHTYGENIIYTIIDEVDSLNKTYWKSLETFWIGYLRFLGFNVLNKNNGGGGPIFLSEETRHKISKASIGKSRNKGRRHSEESKQKISNSMKGILRPESGEKISKSKKGIPQSETHRKNIGDAIRGRKVTWNDKLSKPILQYDLEGNFIQEWKGIKYAAGCLGLNNRIICNCLIGKLKQTGGFTWKYKENE
jgi:hypothetical protein